MDEIDKGEVLKMNLLQTLNDPKVQIEEKRIALVLAERMGKEFRLPDLYFTCRCPGTLYLCIQCQKINMYKDRKGGNWEHENLTEKLFMEIMEKESE